MFGGLPVLFQIVVEETEAEMVKAGAQGTHILRSHTENWLWKEEKINDT